MSRKKGVPNKPKEKPVKVILAQARTEKEKIDEVVEQLDDLFGMNDIVEIDDIIENEQQTPKEVISDTIFDDGINYPPEVKELLIPFTEDPDHHDMSNAPVYGKKVEELSQEFIDISKHLYNIHNNVSIADTYNNFEIKLRHFLMAENLLPTSITYKKLMKFLREYSNGDIDTMKRELNSL